RVMDAELADQRIERRHFRGVAGRHMHRLAADQDVELVRVENEFACAAHDYRLPEVQHLVGSLPVHVDQPGVVFRAIADEAVAAAREIDRECDAAAGDVGLVGRNQRFGPVEGGEFILRKQRIATPEPDLRQARAGAHDDREGARADLNVERAGVALRDLVELAGAVGHHTGEDVEPAGRAFRVGRGRDSFGQGEFFDQRHDVDAARLQNRALAKWNLVQLEMFELVGDTAVGAGQEAGAYAVGNVAQPQVEAGGLDLVGVELTARLQRAGAEQRRDFPIRQYPRLAHAPPPQN